MGESVFLNCNLKGPLRRYIRQLLDRPESDPTFRRKLIVATQRLSNTSNLYPTCYELKNIIQEGQHPVDAGGYADIYKGDFQGQAVCLKAMRMYQNTTIKSFLKPNILINEDGIARLADFGISSVSDPEIVSWTSQSSGSSTGGSSRWQAPELFDVENDESVKNSVESDVYALACVYYEIFTGNIPFYHVTREVAVPLQVKSGNRPIRPLASSPSWNAWGLSEPLWGLMEDCWRAEPSERPSLEKVIGLLAPELAAHDDRTNNSTTLVSPLKFRSRVKPSPDNIIKLSELELLLSCDAESNQLAIGIDETTQTVLGSSELESI
ncbi:hypothetical protein C0991_001359, partial [Blastosporella zonata]